MFELFKLSQLSVV